MRYSHRPASGSNAQRQRPFAQRLQHPEQRLVAHGRKPFVDEHLRRGQDHAAVDVVLGLVDRLISHPNRAMAQKAREFGRDFLVERGERNDAVHRLDRPVVDGDGGDVVDVGFHGLRRAEAIQRFDDEIRVPEPAEAVVPVADRARRLGNRSRMRRDDRSGLGEAAELQRDRRAHHRLLPFERHGRDSATSRASGRACDRETRDRLRRWR